MSFDDAQVLAERSKGFLRNARHLFKKGEYDLAAFSLEQSCQLLVKYRLLLSTGTYPRTHSLSRLMEVLHSSERRRVIDAFMDREVMLITRLEDAYIGSRYLPRRYRRQEVKQLLDFAERFWKVMSDV